MSPTPGKVSSLDSADPILRNLIEKATAARELAYVPYSNFKVGCAILTRKGDIYTGCNVENSSYGLAICAERTTITKAVSHGDHDIVRLVVSTDRPGPNPTVSPCGACRQFIYEFSTKIDIPVYCYNISSKTILETTISELLPWGFRMNE